MRLYRSGVFVAEADDPDAPTRRNVPAALSDMTAAAMRERAARPTHRDFPTSTSGRRESMMIMETLYQSPKRVSRSKPRSISATTRPVSRSPTGSSQRCSSPATSSKAPETIRSRSTAQVIFARVLTPDSSDPGRNYYGLSTDCWMATCGTLSCSSPRLGATTGRPTP